MKTQFSLFKNLEQNLETLDQIDNSIKITLGPTGKNAIVSNKQGVVKIITSGSSLLKSLDFETNSANILLKLFQQASSKSTIISGDGSTMTILFCCELLKISLRLLNNGYNSIFLSNGLKRVGFFLIDKSLEFSIPISTSKELVGVLKTALGKKVNSKILTLLEESVSKIGRDGLILLEENISEQNEIELIQGIELEKGFASSYFVTDLKNFEVIFEKPYVLFANTPIESLNQLREVLEYVKENNRSLVLVVEEINKDVLSTLVLNNLQKKVKLVVIKYKGIEFTKNGILEDLALLSHSTYSSQKFETTNIFNVNDLGQVEKVIVGKTKSTFLFSKFAKLISQRRINELNRELLLSETEFERNLFKTRIARLSGHIAKIKLGVSNKYEMEEQKQKIETALQTVKSSLEEGILPGGGSFYFHLREELANWASMNLVGDEFFSSYIVLETLLRPFQELLRNTNSQQNSFQLLENLVKLGYPYGYNLVEQKIVHTFENGLVDCSKSVRAIIWNSISIISTLITSE